MIDEQGEQLGVLRPEEALDMAKSRGLDLVEISPNAEPPVCKIMDYGKFKYLQKKKAAEAKKHQHQVQLKEVKFRPKIEKHDYEFKLRKAIEFLEEGNKVKLTIRFRGREITRPALAQRIIDQVVEDTKDVGALEGRSTFEGRTMIAILVPVAKQGKGKAPKKEAAKAPETARPEEKPAEKSGDAASEAAAES